MSKNVVWHKTSITKKMREKLLNQKGFVLWFTGLSGSGKSTIASSLESKLYKMGKLTYLLDGDNIRHGLNKDLGFTETDRKENLRRISEVALLLIDSGIITLCTFISPFQNERDKIRKLIGDNYIEVFIDCDLKTCESRDPKGLYKKARKGEINNFTGISSPYERPINPNIVIDTDKYTIDECVEQIISYLVSKDFLSPLREESSNEI